MRRPEEPAMTRILLDAVLREKLNGMTESLEIVDESGKPCALVVPLPRRVEMGQAECPLSEAELDQRRNGPMISHEEVRARLGSS